MVCLTYLDVVEEAFHGLHKLLKQSLREVQAHQPDTLFTSSTWSLVTHSALTLLSSLVAHEYHSSSISDALLKEIENVCSPFPLTHRPPFIHQNERNPACRVYQCKHLPYLVSLLETASPDLRLLAMILLSNTTSSNNFVKKSESTSLFPLITLLLLYRSLHALH